MKLNGMKNEEIKEKEKEGEKSKKTMATIKKQNNNKRVKFRNLINTRKFSFFWF